MTHDHCLMNYESVHWKNFILKNERATRKPNLQREIFSSKRKNEFCRVVKLRHKFYSNRVVPDLNRLLHHVTSAPSINSFSYDGLGQNYVK